MFEPNPYIRVKYTGTIYIKEVLYGFDNKKEIIKVERDFFMQTRSQLKCIIDNMYSLHDLKNKSKTYISVIFD